MPGEVFVYSDENEADDADREFERIEADAAYARDCSAVAAALNAHASGKPRPIRSHHLATDAGPERLFSTRIGKVTAVFASDGGANVFVLHFFAGNEREPAPDRLDVALARLQAWRTHGGLE